MAQALLLILALGAAPARAGLYECVDSKGGSRLTNAPCREGETERISMPGRPAKPPLEPAPAVSSPAPQAPDPARLDERYPLRDKAGKPVRFPPGKVLVETSKFVETRGLVGDWERLRPVRPSALASVRRAVEAFNRVGGLDLELVYAETDDASVTLSSPAANSSRLIVYWGDVSREADRRRPYSIGCFPYARQLSGRILPPCRAKKGTIASLAGGYVQMSELPEAGYGCAVDAEVTLLMRYLADCLGLPIFKEKSGVLGGECGPEFLPRDREVLRELYGRP